VPVVAWDATGFALRFPEFAPAVDPVFAEFFAEAGFLCDNSGRGPVTDPVELKILLFLLTAHIAKLSRGDNEDVAAGGPAPIAGRVSDATQGSVTVRMDVGPNSDAKSWYAQTRYGLDYWNRTSPYRRFRYVATAQPSGLAPVMDGYLRRRC